MRTALAGMILLIGAAGCAATYAGPQAIEARNIIVEPEHDPGQAAVRQNHPNQAPRAEIEVEETTLAGSEVELKADGDDE